MELKKCSFAVALTFAVIILPTTFMILDSNDFWEIRGLILKIFGGERHQDQHHQNRPTSGDDRSNSTHKITIGSISPNLTSCHDSWGRVDLLVNCCPPWSDEASAVPIDYKFPDPSKPLRIRRPVHLLDPDYIAKYTKALAIMKSLPHSDPRSFSRQAHLHCTFCSGAYDMKHTSTILNVHRQWLFYPFHRMYLHFHERILGSLIGDDTFALPFWNWDDPKSMTFPEMYLSGPFVDSQREPTHFAPIIVDLNYDYEQGIVSTDPKQVNANLAFMYTQVVSAAKKPELFMGCPLKPDEGGFCDGPGTVEAAPHNTVHDFVGLASNPEREHMGAFYSAGWDPSFYNHHANLDRIWDVWRDVHNIYSPINDTVWLNSYFYFYDENLQLNKIKVSDTLNITKMRYSYEKTNLLWLNKRPKPSVPPKLAKHILKTKEANNETFRLLSKFPSDKLEGRSLGTPLTVKVQRPKRFRTTREIQEEEEVLVVFGIDVKNDARVKFDVYVNLVDDTKVGPAYREFAGTFDRLPKVLTRRRPAMSGGGDRKSRMKVGISELLKDLEADRDESIWVTILPRSSACVNTTIDGVRIEYMR